MQAVRVAHFQKVSHSLTDLPKNMQHAFLLIILSLLLSSAQAQGYWEYYGEKEGLSDANVTCFLHDKDNFLWIGTENGLNRWDGYHFEIFLPQNRHKNSLSDAFIADLAQDTQGNIWIATHKGLNCYSPEKQTFETFFYHDSLPFSLPNNWVNALLIDEKQEMYVACDNRDLVKYDPQTRQFIPQKWRPFCEEHAEISHKKDYIAIFKMTSISSQTLLLYTNLGEFHFDKATKQPTFLNPKKDSLEMLITLQDKQGLIWKKTSKGFAKWDPSLQYFEPISPKNISFPSLKSIENLTEVIEIEKDAQGNSWIGTDKEGLFIWDKNSQNLRQINEKEYHFLSHSISDIHWDKRRNMMWISTWDYGLYQYDAAKDSFILHQYQEKDSTSLSADVSHQIAEDRQGNIWIATEPGGVSIYEGKNKGFKHLSIENGLPSNSIFGIIADKQGKMWISTSKGLAKIDPISYKVRVYTEKDGIPAEISLKNALYIDSLGYISLITYPQKAQNKGKALYGFRFLPQNLEVPVFATQPHLTDFQVFDKPFPLPKAPDFLSQIEITYEQNVFSFHFSSTDFHRSELHRYKYQLEGYDNIWKNTHEPLARYDHVPPGNYTFWLKTYNADGIENPQIKRIDLRIVPPFWQTIWFRSAIIGLVMAIFIGLYRWRVAQIQQEISLKKEKENLQITFEKQLAEQKMSALRAQMNPHFIFNVLSSISHFIIRKETEKALDFLQDFSQLIRRVLEYSRADFVSLQEELATAQMFLQIEQQRFQHTFTYFVEIADNVDIDLVEIPPLLLQPYIENAIWHGLMHKEEGDRKIWLRVLAKGNFLCIEIEDNGVGRAKAAELKSKKAHLQKSYGLKVTEERLALVNQISQQHQWKLEIVDMLDAEGKACGTKVILY